MRRREQGAFARAALAFTAGGLVLVGAAAWWLGPGAGARDADAPGSTEGSPARISARSLEGDPARGADAVAADDHASRRVERLGRDGEALDEGGRSGQDVPSVPVTGRVLDAEGGPAAGARLWAVPDGDTLHALLGWTLDTLPVPRDGRFDAVADDEGRFLLELPHVDGQGGERWPEVPLLVVEHEGHVVAAVAATGHQTGALDLGEIPLRAGGRVRARLLMSGVEPVDAGRLLARSWVVDAAWRPAVTATVGDALSASGVTDPLDAHVAHTGPDGVVVLDGLPSGTYLVEVAAPGLLRRRLEEITVTAGETTDLGALHLDAGESIDVVVTDQAGEPIRGAELLVSATPVGWEGTPWVSGDDRDLREIERIRRGRPDGRAQTRADGSASVGGLSPEDPHTVALVAEGFQPRILRGVYAAEGRTSRYKLRPQRSMTVLVHEDLPAEQARILWDARAEARRVTGDDRLTRGGLPPSRRLEVRASGGGDADDPLTLAQWMRDGAPVPVLTVHDIGTVETALTVSAEGHAERTVIVDHREGGPLTTVRVALVPEARIDGRVTGGGGSGMRGATVFATPKSGGATRRTRSGADGAFVLERLAPGTWTVHAAAPDHAPSEEREVLLAPRETVTVGLSVRTGGAIRGRVTGPDSRSRRGVAVRITGPESRLVRSDSFGEFTVSDLVPGHYELEAQPEGRGSASVTAAQTSRVDLVTRGPPVLTGRVFDIPQADNGRPVEVVAVPLGAGPGPARHELFRGTLLVDAAWHTEAVDGARGPDAHDGSVSTLAGRRSAYRLELPHAGAWAVYARKQGQQSVDVTYTLDWEQVVVQDLRFGTASVTGVVKEAAHGHPFPGLVVVLDGRRATLDLETVTDEQGRYRFSGLQADEYVVSARPGQGHFAEPVGPFALPDGGLERVDLRVASPGGVDGRVEWTGGTRRCNVLLVDQTGRIADLATRVYRDFSIDGLPPGDYRLVVMESYGRDRAKVREEAQLWLDGEFLPWLPPAGELPVRVVGGGRDEEVHVMAKAYKPGS